MKARVLGSAAGGGFPQWNCGCTNCREARRGSSRTKARSQESLALSADGEAWFLLNASPEIRQQIESFPPLHPRRPRDSPIAGIVLTSGDLDHCLGLLSLRESHPLHLYTTAAVHRGWIEGNVLHRTLQRFERQVTWHSLGLGQLVPLLLPDGTRSGLAVEAVAAPGKLPIHLEGLCVHSDEDSIGLLIHDGATGKKLAYFSGVASDAPGVRAALLAADCVFFDGTFWSSDELRELGLGDKRAQDMAHWPLSGKEGSLAMLAGLSHARRVLIHINNSNPILLDDSVQAAQVRAAGVEIAYDGMQVEL